MLRNQPVQWHGVRLNSPDWGHESHVVAATVPIRGNQLLLHIMVNAYWEALLFETPQVSEAHEPWRRYVDTFLDSPDDICNWSSAPTVTGPTYLVQPRSVVLLLTRSRNSGTA